MTGRARVNLQSFPIAVSRTVTIVERVWSIRTISNALDRFAQSERMSGLHYFRRLCSRGRVMPEVSLRYLNLLKNSSIPNHTGGLLTLFSRRVRTSESRCDSFCESWSVSKGLSGASLRTVICSLALFSESSPGILS